MKQKPKHRRACVPAESRKYIATHLTPEEYRLFSVSAATIGTSRLALMRDLVVKFLAKPSNG